MDEVKRPLIALISILVIAATIVSIYLTQRRPTPKINLKPFEAVGEVAAEETTKLLGGHGRGHLSRPGRPRGGVRAGRVRRQ